MGASQSDQENNETKVREKIADESYKKWNNEKSLPFFLP